MLECRCKIIVILFKMLQFSLYIILSYLYTNYTNDNDTFLLKFSPFLVHSKTSLNTSVFHLGATALLLYGYML